MGKGKGKAGRRAEKAAIKAAKRAEKAAKLALKPRPIKPLTPRKPKVPKELAPASVGNLVMSREGKGFGGKSNIAAKWPALFKKHLGIIEAHIKALDRVMQSMKTVMGELTEDDRRAWELGERGNWRVICGMMDRAREVLTQGREISKDIIPAKHLRDKKGLGVTGTTFEPLEPKLAARAAEMGMGRQVLGMNGRDDGNSKAAAATGSDADTEMTDASSDDSSKLDASNSDSDLDSDDVEPEMINKKNSAKEKRAEIKVEENPYFVIDMEPTPVNLDSTSPDKKKSKKRSERDEPETEPKKIKKAKKSKAEFSSVAQEPVVPEETPASQRAQVDFNAIEAQLQAEVQAGLKAKQEEDEKAAAKAARKEERKRKRSLESGLVAEEGNKKARKGGKGDKKEKKEEKRKNDESDDRDGVDDNSKRKKKRKSEKI